MGILLCATICICEKHKSLSWLSMCNVSSFWSSFRLNQTWNIFSFVEALIRLNLSNMHVNALFFRVSKSASYLDPTPFAHPNSIFFSFHWAYWQDNICQFNNTSLLQCVHITGLVLILGLLHIHLCISHWCFLKNAW
jgi:hypothetical protein